MNRARNISRVIFLLIAVFLLVRINRKTDENVKSIVAFKLDMLQEMRKDSLDSKSKMQLLVNETTHFVDDSSHIKQGVNYLMKLLALVVVVEVIFLILLKRNPG